MRNLFPLFRQLNSISKVITARFNAAFQGKREMSVLTDLLTEHADQPTSGSNKITVVGIGSVGMACAVSILAQNVTDEICLIDKNEEKLVGERMDLEHGCCYLNNPKITASSEYTASACSRICIITSGVRQEVGETRLSLVQRNADMLKDMVPQLVEHSPDTILLMVSNPVEILTLLAWKLSGLPKNRVLGSGTTLDTARFRFFISQRLCVAPTSCHGWIIGEHGDSSVPVWSSVNVGGVLLSHLNPKIGTSEDPEKWDKVHKDVINSAYEIIKLKGYTSWAIGVCVAGLASAILRNTSTIAAVSTSVLGEQCIDQDVFLSLPCVVNANGITSVVKQNLSPTELEKLHHSAKIMAETEAGLK